MIFMGKVKLADRPALAQNIVLRRDSAGLTQEQLAEKIGVHPNTIKGLESGKSYGRQGTLGALAALFNCSVADLMADPIERIPSAASQDAVAKRLIQNPKDLSFPEVSEVLAALGGLNRPRRILVATVLFGKEAVRPFLAPKAQKARSR